MQRRNPAVPQPRERILATARDLFRRHGIRGVGVDVIAEKAKTNKMTLYRHFGSKDELVVSCLEAWAGAARHLWDDLERTYPGRPAEQLRAWIRRAAEYLNSDGRGCDLSNAAVELADEDHPARRVIEAFKVEQRDRLAGLCRDAGLQEPELLADTLTLLVEGARVSRQSMGREGPGARFSKASEVILRAFAAPELQRPARSGF